jgi:hypothetical protein
VTRNLAYTVGDRHTLILYGPDTAVRKKKEESQLTSLAGNIDGNDDHELKTAPLLTRGAYRTKKMRQAVGQYGVLGTITESRYDYNDPKTSFHPDLCNRLPLATSMHDQEFSRLYLNTASEHFY